MSAECIPCQLKRAIFEASLVPGSDENEVVKAAMELLAEKFPPPPGTSNNEITTDVHELVYSVLGTDDAYVDLKKRSNDVAHSILPEVKRLIDDHLDPFEGSLLASVVGNVMDFGIKDTVSEPEELNERFHQLWEDGLFVNDSSKIKERVSDIAERGGEILYITDNAGEIVFDRLLISEIMKHGAKVALMVRGKPILNDATIEDVRELGLEHEVDRVLTTGVLGVGVVMSRIPEYVKKEIFNAELIISKGMGNYEGFADVVGLPPIAFLLRTKCKPVAEDIGFPLGVNVAYLKEKSHIIYRK